VLDNHLVEFGTQYNTSLFYRLLEEEVDVNSNPREFDINPWVILVGKKHNCYITLCLESKRNGIHVVLVLSPMPCASSLVKKLPSHLPVQSFDRTKLMYFFFIVLYCLSFDSSYFIVIGWYISTLWTHL
jgi:hypothetical protein